MWTIPANQQSQNSMSDLVEEEYYLLMTPLKVEIGGKSIDFPPISAFIMPLGPK